MRTREDPFARAQAIRATYLGEILDTLLWESRMSPMESAWALKKILRKFNVPRIVDRVVTEIRTNDRNGLALKDAGEIALLGASKECLNKLVFYLAKDGQHQLALKVANKAGRELKPAEVELIGECYLANARPSEKNEQLIYAMHMNHIGSAAANRFSAAARAMRERA